MQGWVRERNLRADRTSSPLPSRDRGAKAPSTRADHVEADRWSRTRPGSLSAPRDSALTFSDAVLNTELSGAPAAVPVTPYFPTPPADRSMVILPSSSAPCPVWMAREWDVGHHGLHRALMPSGHTSGCE